MVKGAPNGAPSRRNWKLVTVAASVTDACSVVDPVTVEPAVGLVMATTGRVMVGRTCCSTFTVVPVICTSVSVTL